MPCSPFTDFSPPPAKRRRGTRAVGTGSYDAGAEGAIGVTPGADAAGEGALAVGMRGKSGTGAGGVRPQPAKSRSKSRQAPRGMARKMLAFAGLVHVFSTPSRRSHRERHPHARNRQERRL